MRDCIYRSIREFIAKENSPALTWPNELANAIICYFEMIELLKTIAPIQPTIAESRDIDPRGAIEFIQQNITFEDDTRVAMDNSNPTGVRLDAARRILKAYWEKRNMVFDNEKIVEPNIHISHLELLDEYLKGIYEIYEEKLQVVQYSQSEGLGVIGQVTIFRDGDEYVMQGIITCPFFSTFKKSQEIHLSVADALVNCVKEKGLHPRVIPIASNEPWRTRVKGLSSQGTVMLIDDDDIASLDGDDE